MLTATATKVWLIRCSAKHTTRVEGLQPFGRCPQCAQLAKVALVIGRVTDHECGLKCTSAIGPKCDCECGGENHSVDHR